MKENSELKSLHNLLRDKLYVEPKILAQTISASFLIWLSAIHFFNGSSFYALVRGVGLIRYLIDIHLITPEFDLAVWLASLVSTALLSYRLDTPRRLLNKAALILLICSAALYLIANVALLGVMVASAILLYGTISRSDVPLRRRILGIATSLWLIFTASITLPSALRWLANGIDGSPPFSDISWIFSFTDFQLSNALRPLTPRLFLIFAVIWVVRLAFWRRTLVADSNDETIKGFREKILLLVSVLLSVYVGIYPYLPTLNPTSMLVGVDSRLYYSYMETYSSLDTQSLISESLRTDRPIYILFQQGIASLLNVDLTIRIMPSILISLLSISTYCLVSIHSKRLALLAAMYTPLSFQAIAGVNAGFYTNLLALVEVNLALTQYIKGLEKGCRKHLISASALTLAVLYTHPATWTILMVAFALIPIITILRRNLLLREVKFSAALIGINIVGEAVRSLFLGNKTTAAAILEIAPLVTPANITSVVQNLNATFTTFIGGAYSNPLAIILAIIGLFYIASSNNRFFTTLLALTIVCTTSALFTNSTLPNLYQARFIYIIPFHILAAFGTEIIVNTLTTYIGSGMLSKVSATLLHTTIITSLISYTLREVGVIFVPAYR